MKNKMRIFYALGIIYNLWPLALLLNHTWIAALVAYGIMQFIKVIIMLMRMSGATGVLGVSYGWPIIRYLETRCSKKIYHEMGEFWLYMERQESGTYRVVLSEQGYLYDKIIEYGCPYSMSPESLSTWCKDKIDTKYESELKERRMMEEIDKWDGAVDQISKRDKKLGDLGV